MDELAQAKNELNDIYSAITEPYVSLLELLRRYIAYAEFLNTNPVLSRLIASIRKQIASESITDIQKSMADPVYGKVVSMREQIADLYEEERGFPMYVLAQLEDAHTAFNALGDEEDEKKFGEKKLELKHETKDGADGYTETTSGNGLLGSAEYIYPKQLPILHTRLIEELDKVIQTGTFPMYLDYDSEKGILYVQGKPVQIRIRKSLSNAHYLLEYLFNNGPFGKHLYDELEEPVNQVLGKTPRAYYATCQDINVKVETATGIKNFLDFSSGESMYVRVNPNYNT